MMRSGTLPACACSACQALREGPVQRTCLLEVSQALRLHPELLPAPLGLAISIVLHASGELNIIRMAGLICETVGNGICYASLPSLLRACLVSESTRH